MRTKTVLITVVILAALIMFAIVFFNKGKESLPADLPAGTHAVTITEILQTSKYTYFQVSENDKDYWIAVTRREAKEGDVIYYTNPLEMNNFVSKELGRTFPTVFFVQNVSDKPISIETDASPNMATQKKKAPKKADIAIKRIRGGITISELYENPGNFSGKPVKIRGLVTRFNYMVMGKNWVHIQDGTDFSGNFDLAVTTMDSVSIGNTVTFEGKVTLKKDFGAGYYYDVIMEDAKATDIKAGSAE